MILIYRRYSAIMRGAVLHKMGMDLVKERVLRTSYGTVLDDEFRFGHDPENRKFMHINGEWRCRGAMYWFMQKVNLPLPFANA